MVRWSATIKIRSWGQVGMQLLYIQARTLVKTTTDLKQQN